MILSLIMAVRNWMFDHGWLKERAYDVPVICVGNLAVGGTGKTPHTEWIVDRMLREGRHVAILSRGYGRKTKGFVEATPASQATEIGDEPLQMFTRYSGKVVVCVCEDRCRGIEQILCLHPDVETIVLDDAFQHRYVRPLRRLLLTDYSRLYTNDCVMPWGRLREYARGAKRADVIIVTKCPAALDLSQQEAVIARLRPGQHQRVIFTRMDYEELPIPKQDRKNCRCLVLAAIAHPAPFLKHLADEGFMVENTVIFRDHHNFTSSDVLSIESAAAKADYIITTAKDFTRLSSAPLSASTRSKIIVQRIHVTPLDPIDPIELCK